MFSFNSRVSRRYRGTSGHFVVETGQGGILGSVRSARIAGLRRRLRRPRSLALRSRRGSLAFDRKKEATIPRHSMGLPYIPTLTPQTTPTDRHIWQSHVSCLAHILRGFCFCCFCLSDSSPGRLRSGAWEMCLGEASFFPHQAITTASSHRIGKLSGGTPDVRRTRGSRGGCWGGWIGRETDFL